MKIKLVKKIENVLTVKQLFWIISSVVIAVVPHFSRLPIWFPFFVAVIALVTWMSAKKSIKPIPGPLIFLLTLFIFFAIIFFQGFSLNRELSVTILTTMTVLKLLETKSKRDAWMVVTLCYFVILTRFFYSQDFILVLYLVLSIFIITHSLFIIQHANKATYFIRSELKQTMSLLLTGVPLAALFFLFFPRLGSPIWGSPDFFGEGKTGISEEMSPGSISQLFIDDSTAFRVTFNSAIPAKSQLYWRGPVLWDYDGSTWTRNRNLRPVNRDVAFKLDGIKTSYEIELEPTGQNYLFSLDYMLESPEGTVLLPDLELISKLKINQLGHYKMTSLLKTYNPYEWLSNKTLERLTRLPEGYNPETQKLINSWVAIDKRPEQLIQKALKWFATDDFYYSYSPPSLHGDTVDQFLFDTKTGFCEHYASAFTIMMRAAGIPARVVTGYQGGIKNGDYLLIKQSDAHAWSEVWIKDKGWLRVDPTAAVSPLRVERGSQALMSQQSRTWYDYGWSRKLGERYDVVRHKWNKWVRDYNVVKQRALFQFVGFDSKDGKSIAIVLSSIMVITTILVLLFLYITRPKRKFNYYDKIYHKFVKSFYKKGLTKSNSLGVSKFTEIAVKQFPHIKNNIEEFTQLYLKLRFSNYKTRQKLLDKRLLNLIIKIRQQI